MKFFLRLSDKLLVMYFICFFQQLICMGQFCCNIENATSKTLVIAQVKFPERAKTIELTILPGGLRELQLNDVPYFGLICFKMLRNNQPQTFAAKYIQLTPEGKTENMTISSGEHWKIYEDTSKNLWYHVKTAS